MKRSDITHVPAIVFPSDGTKAEAESFLNANTLRRAVTAIEKFKAQLEAEDPTALEVKKLIDAAGRKVSVSNSPHSIACVGRMYRTMLTDSKVLKHVWPTIISTCDGHPMYETVISAMVHIEKNLPDGVSLCQPRWRSRLRDIGAQELLRAAQQASAYYARGGAKVWADGCLKRINRGLSDSRKLTLVNGAAGA